VKRITVRTMNKEEHRFDGGESPKEGKHVLTITFGEHGVRTEINFPYTNIEFWSEKIIPDGEA